MPLDDAFIKNWCHELLGWSSAKPPLPLAGYLEGIPRLDSLADIASGTHVLVRGDLDAKPGAKVGDGDIRLRSMLETLEFGRRGGWKQILFGHIGRKPEGSLRAVGKRLGELLNTEVRLVEDWLDESGPTIRTAAVQAVRDSAPGSVLLLENTRRYALERCLWDATAESIASQAPALARLANEFASKLAQVYVNEAISAGSLDSSTVIVPLAMARVALGAYVGREFDGPIKRCLEAELAILSGLKSDKLDDLTAIMQRGAVRLVFVAGSLAMALKKAQAQLDGADFCLGVATDPAHADKPYYISEKRIEQSRGILREARHRNVRIVLPVDFVLADGRVASTLTPQDQQFDVGPASSALFAAEIDKFIASSAGRRTAAFHNGVFGMFEDARFETGTRDFIHQLHRLKQAGVEVYVGGGEGGEALTRYGQPDWVTHCFTAGGTVLNALGTAPVPFLQALHAAARRATH